MPFSRPPIPEARAGSQAPQWSWPLSRAGASRASTRKAPSSEDGVRDHVGAWTFHSLALSLHFSVPQFPLLKNGKEWARIYGWGKNNPRILA